MKVISKNLLSLVRNQLEKIEIHDSNLARLICNIIPRTCPFERKVTLCGHTLFHVPPLCKLNPFYDQMIELRLKSLVYLEEMYQR